MNRLIQAATALLFVAASMANSWTPQATLSGSLPGLVKLRVEARQITGSSTYPTLVLAGPARPTSAPMLSAKPGRWSCNAGVNSWVCQRELPVGAVPNDTLGLQWPIASGLPKIDSIRPISGGWIVYVGVTNLLPPALSREYSILGSNGVRMADRAKVFAGPIGAGSILESGATDSLGDLMVKGNAILRENVVAKGMMKYTGTVNLGPNTKVTNGMERSEVVLPSVAGLSCVPGASDVNLNTGKLVLAPGAYRNLSANSGTELVLSGGVYQFASFVLNPNVVVTLNGGANLIDVRSAGTMQFSDGVTMRASNSNLEPENVRWTSNGTSTVRLGNAGTFIGWFRTPNATLYLGSRTKVTGALHGLQVQLDPDCYGILQGVGNAAPMIGGTPKDTVTVGKVWQFSPTGTDLEGESLTWTLTKFPVGAAIQASTGLVSWTPDAVGLADFAMKVCDLSGGCTEAAWQVSATRSNQPPQFQPAAVVSSGVEGQAWSMVSSASDPDGDPLAWSVVGDLPAGMAFDAITHSLGWTPDYDQAGEYQVVLQVRAGADSVRQTIRISIANKNRNPSFASPSVELNGLENQLVSFTSTASDPDGDPLQWSVSGTLPEGMQWESTTHELKWRPTFTQSGTYEARLVVRDGSDSAVQILRWNIANVNRAPIPGVSSSYPAKEGLPFSQNLSASDPDGDPLTMRALQLPQGMHFDPSTRLVTWTPSFDQAGISSAVFEVADNTDAVVFPLVVSVADSNRAPVILSNPPRTGKERVPYSYVLVAEDPDGTPVRIDGYSLAPGMMFDPTSGRLDWEPMVGQAGSYPVSIAIGDGSNQVIQSWTVVVDPNLPPVFTSIMPTETREGRTFRYPLEATDPDGDPLVYSTIAIAPGMGYDASTRMLSWTPDFSQEGSYPIVVSVTDGIHPPVMQSWNLAVLDSNRAPVVRSQPPNSAKEGASYSYHLDVFDPDGGTPFVFLEVAPPGLNFDPVKFSIDWTPTLGMAGSHQVSVSLRDGDQTVTQSWTVVVDPNLPPRFESDPPVEIKEGLAFRYQPIVTDPESDPLVILPGRMAPGMTFDAATTSMVWEPDFLQAGVYPVSLILIDGYNPPVEQAWNLVVLDSNQAPVVRSEPVLTAKQGVPYTYVMDVFDADGDPILFPVQSLPPGMTFNEASRTFDWIPGLVPPGTYPVSVVVSDGIHSVVHAWAIEVAANLPPTIVSEAPAFIKEGETLHYQVLASDPEGDAITYSWIQLAPGMTYDAATHSLDWTPDFAQAGIYQVGVWVHDGINPPVEQRWSLQVLDSNRTSMVALSGPQTAIVGNPYEASVSMSDPDGDPLQVFLEQVPAGMQFDPIASLLRWMPSPDQVGPQAIRIRVSDPFGRSVETQMTVQVQAPAAAPVALVALGGNNRIYLNWLPGEPASGAEYGIYRSSSSEGPFTRIGGSGTALEYSDLGLPVGTAFYYQVRREGSASSLPSNTATSGASSGLRAAPEGFQAVAGNSRVDLSWTFVYSGSRTGYEIFRYAGTETWPTRVGVASAMSSSFSDLTVTNGQRYRYFLVDNDQSIKGGTYSSPTPILTVTPGI